MEAQQISRLFYWMLGGAVVIWLIVIGLTVYAVTTKRDYDPNSMRRVIIGGGAVFPTVVLTGLLAYGLSMMPDLQRPAPSGSVTVHVSGVRWWWRVQYMTPSTVAKGEIDKTNLNNYPASERAATRSNAFEAANEIVLPVNEAVEFKLTSEDVVHSFWIPSLGGKMDMVPGRETRLKLRPLEVGTYRGVCAEYCGESHAQMAFVVKVVERAEFDLWFERQRQPATVTESRQAAGLNLFLAHGCNACHTIRGTAAHGTLAPDLTHVGSRATLAAGWLPNDRTHLYQWLKETKSVKPGVEMPEFGSLAEEDLLLLAEFLEGLK